MHVRTSLLHWHPLTFHFLSHLPSHSPQIYMHTSITWNTPSTSHSSHLTLHTIIPTSPHQSCPFNLCPSILLSIILFVPDEAIWRNLVIFFAYSIYYVLPKYILRNSSQYTCSTSSLTFMVHFAQNFFASRSRSRSRSGWSTLPWNRQRSTRTLFSIFDFIHLKP